MNTAAEILATSLGMGGESLTRPVARFVTQSPPRRQGRRKPALASDTANVGKFR
jgi:hypothetical protein